MATTAKRAKKPNPHTPVSNEPETAEAAPKKPASKPPSEGSDAKAVKAKQDGSEAVEGFKLPRGAAEAMAETMRAPATTNLRDIAEATYGPPPPQLEIVHGPDNRVRITTTSAYPWRAHASLLITAADDSQRIGTGWFIGPHTLMTAGHVVNIPRQRRRRARWLGPTHPGHAGPKRGRRCHTGRSPARAFARSPAGPPARAAMKTTITAPSSCRKTFEPRQAGSGSVFTRMRTSRIPSGTLPAIPGDKPAGEPPVRRAPHRLGQQPQGLLRHRYRGRPERQRRVSDRQRRSRYAFAIHAYGGATTNSGTRIVDARVSTTWSRGRHSRHA